MTLMEVWQNQGRDQLPMERVHDSRYGVTHNESQIAGWYKSKITCGPEPKPIRTGATLHLMAVSFGLLAG
jgi:hypothetical protein